MNSEIKYEISGLQVLSEYRDNPDEALMMFREKIQESKTIEEQIIIETLNDCEYSEYLTSPLEDTFKRVKNNHNCPLYLSTDTTMLDNKIINFTAQTISVFLGESSLKKPIKDISVIEFLSAILECLDEVIATRDYVIGVSPSCVYHYDVDLTNFDVEVN